MPDLGHSRHLPSSVCTLRPDSDIARRRRYPSPRIYPRGLTAFDALDEIILGTRPTLSHATARFEIDNLINVTGLRGVGISNAMADHSRDGLKDLLVIVVRRR